MEAIAKYAHYLETELQKLDFPATPGNLYDPLRYFMTLGGKRIRPMLTLLGAELFGTAGEKAIHAALSVEIFHNFSLIHDDIMDEAPLRRKQPTVHTRWNNNVAILSGDVLLVKAYQEICKQAPEVLPELMQVFNRTAVEVCEGQQHDMDFEKESTVSIPAYIEMIRLKTSVLLGCALQMGAIVAGASTADQQLIYEFGQHIGIAFQIQDDILDLYADPEKFGKQVGGDVIANKKTLLLLKAFEMADEQQSAKLNHLITVQNTTEKIIGVRTIFDEIGVQAAARKIMDKHAALAMEALAAIDVHEEKKQPLLELSDFLLVREF